MKNEIEAAARRFAVFSQDVVEPLIHSHAVPLEAAAYQCSDPIPYSAAVKLAYTPVPLGWRWGPVWSTAWFRLSGRVPAQMEGRPVVLRFSCGTEALLWDDGGPRQGFDPNHSAAMLYNAACGGERVELFVEAACNRPLGATFFWWDAPELRDRWRQPEPGRLDLCELAVYDPGMWRLWCMYEFARQLLLLHVEDAPRTRQLWAVLEQVTSRLAAADPRAEAAEAQAVLEAALRGTPPTRTRCLAGGHAHIDTAWLWTLRETQRKCLRTFASALTLMEAYPDFHFLCSQAQQYAWVQAAAPELFARIAARVREQRWEAAGAMWVECDGNLPAGESFVRQILLGTRYWQEAFGPHAPQRLLYLPDTFGFSPALPQIMAQSGLDTFITNKLAWNDTNEFPYVSFRWRGLDGSEVVAHCTPGRDYNATLTPAELQRGEQEISRKGGGAATVWFQPFGYGDGGGGPTAGMIENARLARQCEGMPEVALAGARAFCDELHRERAALRAAGRDFPVWDGELYLEYHRGTYTTQAWLKRANRQNEQSLRTAEWLTFAGPSAIEPATAQRVRARLDEAWKLLLLNQFHDILPGSSIGEVYVEAREQHDLIRTVCDELIHDRTGAWAQQADTTGLHAPLLVLNPGSTARAGVVECAGDLHYVDDVPALGAAVRDRAQPAAAVPVVVRGQSLSNGIISATIDDAGRIVSLHRTDSGREAGYRCSAGAPAPLNQLVLYEDRPRWWDAWDIDAEYEQTAAPVDGPAESWRVIETGPLRAAIEVTRPIGKASRLVQKFVLAAGSPRLDIQTRVEWHEAHRLLRALFPVDVRSARVTCETQFGYVERPTHRNTSWEEARFEFCAHRWIDLSEPGFGVALLNDCKYGHSCHDYVLGLSLLRSPKFPDPQADMGTHEFTYSLMVHDGDWRAAGVDHEAEALNAPLWAVPLPPGQHGVLRNEWAPFTVTTSGAAGVTCAAVKCSEDERFLIVRLVETHGGQGTVSVDWNLALESVAPVDLLERPVTLPGFTHDATQRRTTFTLRPFRIVTLAARRS